MANNLKYFEGVGRRKRSVARARIYKKTVNVKNSVNGKDPKEFFQIEELLNIISAPFRATDSVEKVNFSVKVSGGGVRGQAEATRMAVSRALVKFNEDYSKTLKDFDYLTRDSRRKERKKAGLKKARRAPQWQKR